MRTRVSDETISLFEEEFLKMTTGQFEFWSAQFPDELKDKAVNYWYILNEIIRYSKSKGSRSAYVEQDKIISSIDNFELDTVRKYINTAVRHGMILSKSRLDDQRKKEIRVSDEWISHIHNTMKRWNREWLDFYKNNRNAVESWV